MDALLSVPWISLLRVSVVLAIGLLAVSLLHRASSSSRHFLLVLSVIGALVAPLLSLTLPDVRFRLPKIAASMRAVVATRPAMPPSVNPRQASPISMNPLAARALPALPVTDTPTARQSLPTAGHAGHAPVALARRPFPAIPPVTWLWLWGAGTVVLLGRLLLGMIAARRIIRRAERADDPVLAVAAQAAGALALPSVPTVRLSAFVPTPAISGIFRICVLLPSTISAWPAAMLRAALLHEFAHVRRRDTVSQLLVELLCAFYWFNPLAWLTARHMRIERELACDDVVLNAGVPNRAYADVLLESVKTLHDRRAPAFAGLAMARTTKLKRRLLDIMNPRRNRKPLTIIGIMLLVLAAAATAILVAIPGARTKITSLIAPKPLPENQNLIVTKDKWRLRGPVKRVELYNGSNWDDKAHPPILLETLDFNEAGQVTRREEMLSEVENLTTTWQYNKLGKLIGTEYSYQFEKPSPPDPKNDSAGLQGVLPRNNAYEFTGIAHPYLYMRPPSLLQVEYDRQGNIQTMSTTSENSHDIESLHFEYDEKGNPMSFTYNGEVRRKSSIGYTYDAAGNWIAQQRDDEYMTGWIGKHTYQYLRRITYYPGTQRKSAGGGIRFTRETFALRGPVTAIEGQGLLERLDEEVGGGLAFPFIDRVEFDQRGRVTAATRWDGEPTPDNLMIREQFVYYTNGTLRARTARNIYPNGIRSYAFSGVNDLVSGKALLPSQTLFLDQRNSKHIFRYNGYGRLIENQLTVGDDYYAHAVCRYSGDDGVITVTGRDGKVTDRIRLNITRDRYGNLLSRRYDWEMENSAPSKLTEAMHYQLSYTGESTRGKKAGGERSRGVRIQAADRPLQEAAEITISGPAPMQLSASLLPLGDNMHMFYSTGDAVGWFPFRVKGGNVRATEAGIDNRLSIPAVASAVGPTPTEGMVVLERFNNYSGLAEGIWQLALYPVSGSLRGAFSLSFKPQKRSTKVGYGHGIEYACGNANIIWLPAQKQYLVIAENHSQYMPGITIATANTDGTIKDSRTLPFSGYSPRVARTRDGIALCFVQRDRYAIKGIIRFYSSNDGKQWTDSRPLFPRLTNPKEVAIAGDGRGTLYLLALCHTQVAAVGYPSPATLYSAVSHDSGSTWTSPRKIATVESDFSDNPTISLTLDARDEPWYTFVELGPLQDSDPGPRYSPGARSLARIIVGRLDH